MIISTIEELNALLPANVSCNTTRLLSLMEQTEEAYLRPLLGRPLYDAVTRAYAYIVQEYANATNGPLPFLLSFDTQRSEVAPEVVLIRLLQVPVVYMTLANNAALLSVSVNDAGLNMVSAEDYAAAGKDDREAFARDCYLNAHRGMERVLLFLEEDARSASPTFFELWRESASFYQQNDLFLRTATDFDRLVPINESRELYLQIVPSIRRAQEVFIRPELGDELTDALIAYNILGPQPKPEDDEPQSASEEEEGGEDAAPETIPEDTTSPSENKSEDTSPSDDEEKTFTQKYAAADFDPAEYIFYPDIFLDVESFREHLPVKRYEGMPAENRIKLNVWNRALTFARTAVAYYAEEDNKKTKRPESRNDAMRALARLKEHIEQNTASFAGVIEKSPLFHETATTYSLRNPTEVQDEKPKQKEEPGYVHDPFGAIFG